MPHAKKKLPASAERLAAFDQCAERQGGVREERQLSGVTYAKKLTPTQLGGLYGYLKNAGVASFRALVTYQGLEAAGAVLCRWPRPSELLRLARKYRADGDDDTPRRYHTLVVTLSGPARARGARGGGGGGGGDPLPRTVIEGSWADQVERESRQARAPPQRPASTPQASRAPPQQAPPQQQASHHNSGYSNGYADGDGETGSGTPANPWAALVGAQGANFIQITRDSGLLYIWMHDDKVAPGLKRVHMSGMDEDGLAAGHAALVARARALGLREVGEPRAIASSLADDAWEGADEM